MLVIVLENAPARLRGRLALWLHEVRANIFVGVYSKRVRERLWDETRAMIGAGSAVIIWASPTDSGFAFDSVGANRRECVGVDGMALVRFRPKETAV